MKREEQQEAIAQCREWFKPGDTVYTILEHVSRSGMSRTIRVVLLYITKQNGEPLSGGSYYPSDVKVDFIHPNHAVATAIGARLDSKRNGIVIGGCGFDAGHHLVYELSSVLYGGQLVGDVYKDSATHDQPGGRLLTRDGAPAGKVWLGGYRCLGKGRCPSNYHVNHRDRVRCEGVGTGDDRVQCYAPSRWHGYSIAEDWPRRTITVEGEIIDAGYLACIKNREDDGAYVVCPTCEGAGDVPNPEGPERFDLVHTDGYALKQRWL